MIILGRRGLAAQRLNNNELLRPRESRPAPNLPLVDDLEMNYRVAILALGDGLLARPKRC